MLSERSGLAELNGFLPLLMLNHPPPLNDLSLPMIRDLATLPTAWAADASIQAGDKDHALKWQPAIVYGLDVAEVANFSVSPWRGGAHPLPGLV